MFSIGQVVLEGDALYLSFRVYEFQYVGMLRLGSSFSSF